MAVCLFFPGKVSGGESKRIGVVAPFERKNAAEREKKRASFKVTYGNLT